MALKEKVEDPAPFARFILFELYDKMRTDETHGDQGVFSTSEDNQRYVSATCTEEPGFYLEKDSHGSRTTNETLIEDPGYDDNNFTFQIKKKSNSRLQVSYEFSDEDKEQDLDIEALLQLWETFNDLMESLRSLPGTSAFKNEETFQKEAME
uniref:Uncharacterized protein n=1 Tax=Magallana gigas TaxID=29159 RepID=K1PLT5_MAGGI